MIYLLPCPRMIRAPCEYFIFKICQFLTFYLVKSSPSDLQNFIQRQRSFYASTVGIVSMCDWLLVRYLHYLNPVKCCLTLNYLNCGSTSIPICFLMTTQIVGHSLILWKITRIQIMCKSIGNQAYDLFCSFYISQVRGTTSWVQSDQKIFWE